MTTTVTLNPDGVTSNAGFALTGGTLNAVLADANDGTYALGGEGNPGDPADAFEVTVGTSSLPTGSRVTGVALRSRHQAVPAEPGTGISGVFTIFTGTGYVGTWIISNPPRAALGTALATYTGPSAAKRGDGTDWTQADIDALRARFATDGQQPDALQVTKLEVLVTYAVRPVVTVSAPTGTLTISQPTVAWSSVFDVGTQDRYRVRVFTAAQYGIGGFDPATSPSTWDSGEVVSGATSVVVAVPLANAVYRAYVATASTVNGSPLWSADTAFSGFTISTTPPGVPTITATADHANRRIALLLNDTGAVATNYFVVERSTDNGASWAPQRGGATVTPGTGTTIYDYDAGNGQSMRYRARAVNNVIGAPALLSSAFSSATTATAWTADVWRLAVPASPTLGVDLRPWMPGYPRERRRKPQGANDVLGREDVVVVSDVRKLSEGEWSVVTLDIAEADALAAALDYEGTVLLHGPPGTRWGSRYLVVGEHTIDDLGGTELELARRESFAWREVTAPPDGAP
jgi:hypothetical protein